MADNYIIFRKNLVYMALYIKNSQTRSKETSITADQLNNYVAHVKAAIEKEQRIAKSFTFEIRTQGEADYSDYKTAPPDIKNRLQTTTYTYDPDARVYKTTNNYNDLSLKADMVLPAILGSCYFPPNFEQILGIESSSEEEME